MGGSSTIQSTNLSKNKAISTDLSNNKYAQSTKNQYYGPLMMDIKSG